MCISNLFQSKCYLTTWQDSGDNGQGCRIAVVTDSIFVRAQQNQGRGIVDSEAKTWVSGSKQPDEHGTSRHTVNTTYGEPRDFLSSLTCGNTEGSIQQLPEMSGYEQELTVVALSLAVIQCHSQSLRGCPQRCPLCLNPGHTTVLDCQLPAVTVTQTPPGCALSWSPLALEREPPNQVFIA